MAKKSYKFNPETLSYEVVKTPVRLRAYRILRKIFIGFILASVVNFVFSYFFYTPKLYAINRDNSELKLRYTLLQDKINSSTKKLWEIRQRDNHIYRQLLGVDSLYIEGVFAPYPEEKYNELQGEVFSPTMVRTWKDVDAMARLLYLESKSFDQSQELAMGKELMAFSIPAIWPIDRRLMNSSSIGRYGMRNHPILHRYIQHKGVDFGAPKGTPVYATGNATVIQDPNSGTGYGNYILLDHGFGYVTRYAHLSKVLVTIGQHVNRGEIIGEVGNTGRSKGAHLHYEVMLMGKTVDPINYIRMDMDEAEFERVLSTAKDTTFEEDIAE